MAIGCVRRAWRHWRTLSVLGLLPLTGCSSLWEEVTSREFKVKNLFTRPDPIVVMRESTDGDKRAKALLAMKEPRGHGGGDLEQNTVLQIMNAAATTDRQPLVRLAAVEQLGTFQDQRAIPILEDAFYKAGDFSPEIATRIQCRVLTSMGETRKPEVKRFLIDKLKEPTAERSDLAQQRNDRCLAAARALGNFPDDTAVSEALFATFSNEKEDVALRDRAHVSLQDITGERLPAEVAVWEQYLHPQPGQPRPHRSRWMELASYVIPDRKEPLPRVPTPGTQPEPVKELPPLQTPQGPSAAAGNPAPTAPSSN
ncbi:MAG: HEAT repeat domain-containing protein [Gemmataceae bacterium]